MASSHTRWITLAAVVALVGCKPKPVEPVDAAPVDAGAAVVADVPARPAPNIVRDEGPMPAPDTPIATAGDIEVTVADFEHSSKVSLLFAPDGVTELAAEQLAIPHVHLTMARSLLSQKLVSAELARRGVAPSKEQMDEWLRAHPRLGKYGALLEDESALDAELGKLGLTRADLYEVATAEVGNTLLADTMAAEIDDEEVWNVYRFENTTRTAAIVGSRNVPTSDEIDEWMGDHPDEIDEHFQKNLRKYRTPKRVRLNIVKPAPDTEVSRDKLAKASEMLLKGIQPITVAKELGMVHELDAQLVRGENPKAFAQKPGEGGWADKGARGAYAWKVTGFEPSKLPEMTRPLRREIAAELLRTTTIVPHVRERLSAAGELLAKAKFVAEDTAGIDALEKEIEALEGLSFQITTFPNNPNGPLPNHGLAEEVIDTAFKTKVGRSSDPFLSRERGFVVRVLSAHTPTRKEFDKEADKHREVFIQAIKPRMAVTWAERRLNELGANIDVKPLRIKYGVLQKR